MTVRSVTFFVALVALATLAAHCPDKKGTVPSASSDATPLVTVGTYVPGGKGEVSESTTAFRGHVTHDVYARPGTELLIMSNASNPGGVQSYSIVVSQAGSELFRVGTTSMPDEKGEVPTILRIPGHDGQGGVGGEPIGLTLNAPATLVATARNFNGQTSELTVRFIPLGPIAAWITAEPKSTAPGNSSTLSWATSNATSASISPGGPSGAWVVYHSQMVVNPTSTTTFTLEARNPFETRSATTTVEIGGISLVYEFDSPSAQPFPIEVHFTGALLVPDESLGSFTKTLDTKFTGEADPSAAGSPVSVRTALGPWANLREGTWRVTATPSCCGPPVECTNVRVPGPVTLSAASGKVSCRPE